MEKAQKGNLMKTECIKREYEFQALDRRKVVGKFDGGMITTDGGGLLLREVEERFGIIGRFAECFTDHRNPDLIEHTVGLLRKGSRNTSLTLKDLWSHANVFLVKRQEME